MAEKKTVTKGNPTGGKKEIKKEEKHVHKAEAKKEEKKEVKKEEKEVKKGKKSLEEIETEIQDLTVIKYPLITEKAVNMIEAENKLTFIVDKNADKLSIKKSIEGLYKVKVNAVNILKDMKSRKKAIVTIDKKYKADDIATKLGVI
ncbi:MAG: 50S ribosomal protein L23 [archaeon]|nr:50S ribosomal protein L23 [archaeon]